MQNIKGLFFLIGCVGSSPKKSASTCMSDNKIAISHRSHFVVRSFQASHLSCIGRATKKLEYAWQRGKDQHDGRPLAGSKLQSYFSPYACGQKFHYFSMFIETL